MWEVLRQLLDSGLLQKIPQEKRKGEEVKKEGQSSLSAGKIFTIQYVADQAVCVCVYMFVCFFSSPQQGLRSLQDLAPEMRLAMACDLEEEEGVDGEMTGDETFNSDAGTSANTTPASTPMPPIEVLVEQTTVFIDPETKMAKRKSVTEHVITEQVTGLHHAERPGSAFAGVSVVTSQPVRFEPLPIRSVI